MTCYQPADKTQPRMLRDRHGEQCPARLAETATGATHNPSPGASSTGVISGAQNDAQCPGCEPCPACTHDGDGTHQRTCIVCSTPLPPRKPGPGRPRITCPDETSPTPGGCARWRNLEQTLHRDGEHRDTKLTDRDRDTIARVFGGHPVIIE